MLKKISERISGFFTGNRERKFFLISAIKFYLISFLMYFLSFVLQILIKIILNNYFDFSDPLVDIFESIIISIIYFIKSISGILGLVTLIYWMCLEIISTIDFKLIGVSEKGLNNIDLASYVGNLREEIEDGKEGLELDKNKSLKSNLEVLERHENKILNSYYTQVLEQSSISFNVSLLFAALGFFVIVFSIFQGDIERFITSIDSQTALATKDLQNNIIGNNNSWITLVSGVIIEAVAVLFFAQTNEARKTMTEFSEKIRLDTDKRRLDSKLVKALELIDKIECENIQSKVKALVVLNFSGLDMKYDDQNILKQILESKSDNLKD